MKNRSTYALLVQSEEKSRNIMETALYALFALSAVVSIWQFAQQPSSLPLERVGTVNEQRIASYKQGHLTMNERSFIVSAQCPTPS